MIKNKDQIERLWRLRLHGDVANISRYISLRELLCLVVTRIRLQYTADCPEHRSDEVSFYQNFPGIFCMSRFIFVIATPPGMRYDLSFAWALLQRGEIIKFPLHFRVARVRAYGYLYQARCTYRITIALKYIIRRNGSLPEFARRCQIYIKHKLVHSPSQLLGRFRNYI